MAGSRSTISDGVEAGRAGGSSMATAAAAAAAAAAEEEERWPHGHAPNGPSGPRRLS
jgi:hypothetical protein